MTKQRKDTDPLTMKDIEKILNEVKEPINPFPYMSPRMKKEFDKVTKEEFDKRYKK